MAFHEFCINEVASCLRPSTAGKPLWVYKDVFTARLKQEAISSLIWTPSSCGREVYFFLSYKNFFLYTAVFVNSRS